MIITNLYKQTPGQIGRRGVDIWLSRWWFAVAFPLVSLLIASLWDWRILIVAFALVLIAYPALLMFVFYGYALNPKMALHLIPHKAEISEVGITIRYFSVDDESEAHETKIVPISAIKKVEDTGKSIYISIDSEQNDWIEIPVSAFKSPTDIKSTLAILQIKLGEAEENA